jgi:hypothetical protein
MKEFSVLRRPGSDLLFHALRRSTIGAGAIYGRVRDGIGYGHPAKATRPAKNRGIFEAQSIWSGAHAFAGALFKSFKTHHRCRWTSIMRAIKPFERLVPVSCAHCCVSTPGLSTWSSSTVLKGELVSRWVSRLDAFSGYPVHT